MPPDRPSPAGWILARHALEQAEAVMRRNDAITTLVHCLGHGMIGAKAETMLVLRQRQVIQRAENQLIPPTLWSKFHFFNDRLLWTNNAVAFTTEFDAALNPSAAISCFNVRFNAAEVRHLTGQPEAPPTGAVDAGRDPGGRPRKAWWDALWVEICRQLHAGALKPEHQADIEHAMLDWAARHGHDLSESAARARAKLLYAALNRD